MSRIKGIQVILIDKESTRMDPFGNEIYEMCIRDRAMRGHGFKEKGLLQYVK